MHSFLSCMQPGLLHMPAAAPFPSLFFRPLYTYGFPALRPGTHRYPPYLLFTCTFGSPGHTSHRGSANLKANPSNHHLRTACNRVSGYRSRSIRQLSLPDPIRSNPWYQRLSSRRAASSSTNLQSPLLVPLHLHRWTLHPAPQHRLRSTLGPSGPSRAR